MDRIFALAYISQLLDVTARTELVPERPERDADRAAECKMPDGNQVKFKFSPEHTEGVSRTMMRRID